MGVFALGDWDVKNRLDEEGRTCEKTKFNLSDFGDEYHSGGLRREECCFGSGHSAELIFFEESDPALINSFYPGLDAVELHQQAFYMPPIATHPCEIVFVEVKDAKNVQDVADIFRARIELGADNTTYPESAAGWRLYAQVQVSGNFVCMIVLPKGNVIPENVFEA